MKHYCTQFILTFVLTLPSFSFACAPLTPNTTMLARLQAVEPSAKVQSYTNDMMYAEKNGEKYLVN